MTRPLKQVLRTNKKTKEWARNLTSMFEQLFRQERSTWDSNPEPSAHYFELVKARQKVGGGRSTIEPINPKTILITPPE
jgi:hypothetical protein